jgi:hypothetical protein
LAAAAFTGLAAGLDFVAARALAALLLLAGPTFAPAALAGARWDLTAFGFAVFFAFVATSVPSFFYPSRAQRIVPHHIARRARILAA